MWRLVDQGALTVPRPLASRCRRALWLRAVWRRPSATLGGFLEQCVQDAQYGIEALLKRRSPGLEVALFGPDGAGKSSTLSLTRSAPRGSLPFAHVEVEGMHGRLWRVLARLASAGERLFRRSAPRQVVLDKPRTLAERGPTWVVTRLVCYALDQCLEEPRRRRKLASNALLFHDRHLVEIACVPQHHRYGYSGPGWLTCWIGWLVPKPDLIILLDVPAEILQARKQDVSFEESARQREAFRAHCAAMPNARVVDGTQPVADVAADVKRAIVEFLAARTARRVGAALAAEAPPGASKASSRSTTDFPDGPL